MIIAVASNQSGILETKEYTNLTEKNYISPIVKDFVFYFYLRELGKIKQISFIIEPENKASFLTIHQDEIESIVSQF